MNSRLNFRSSLPPAPSSASASHHVATNPPFEEAIGLLLDRNGGEFERRVKTGEIHADVLSCRDGRQRSLLVHAAIADQLKAFMLLTKRGLSMMDKDSYEMTPLHYAVMSDSMKTVKHILLQPRNPSEIAPFLVGDKNGVTPLHIAATKQSWSMLKTLLDARKETDNCHGYAIDRKGRSPFHYAAMHASLECCVLLMNQNHGFPMDQRDNFGFTPMIIAAGVRSTDSAEIVRRLGVAKSTACTKRSNAGMSALHMAVLADNIPVIKVLLGELRCLPNSFDNESRTPLHYAAQHGREAAAALLLQHGASNSVRDKYEVTAAHYAAQQDPDTLDVILKSIDYDLENVNDKQGRSIFMWGVLAGNTKIVEYCLRKKDLTINRCETDKRGLTALHLATHMGNLELCKVLMQQGWNPSNSDNYGATPLHIAAGRGYTEVVRYLVTSGADSEARDMQGRTPVFHACLGGNKLTLETMINSLGFNIENRDVQRSTPLHAAAFAGHAACISALVQANADVSETDKDDYTALHIAAERGKLECCVRLIQSGAAVNALSKVLQMTPVSCGAINGHDKVVEYLRLNGGMTTEEVKRMAATIVQKFWRRWRALKRNNAPVVTINAVRWE